MLRKKLRLLFLLLLLLPSCSPFQKTLKSNDMGLKYKKGVEYFNKGNYDKAAQLFENIREAYGPSEDLEYYIAYSNYKLENYLLGSYHFHNLAETYPLGSHAEEAYFLYAYCLYMDSPRKDLDQASTKEAINAFLLFTSKFSDSKKVDEANRYIDELQLKLEQKAIDNAVLYYKIEDYKSAVWALRDVVNTYPYTKQREKLEFYIVDASYELAKKSIESKQKERYANTLEYYNEFREKYPQSNYDKELRNIEFNTKKELGIK